MATKLTLTVEKSVIEKAKYYAKQTGRSLSEIIENYLESITSEEKSKTELSPKLRKILGAVQLPKDFDKKQALRGYLEQKHLRWEYSLTPIFYSIWSLTGNLSANLIFIFSLRQRRTKWNFYIIPLYFNNPLGLEEIPGWKGITYGINPFIGLFESSVYRWRCYPSRAEIKTQRFWVCA